jgi:hypothetical protein
LVQEIGSITNVTLKWVTASEINNDYFTIERSKDAVYFEQVLLLDGAGNSANQRYYSVIDDLPFNGTTYYRLKQTDFNGDFSYSKVVSVNNTAIQEKWNVSLVPNPSSGYVSFRFEDEPVFPSRLQVVSLSGQLLREIEISATSLNVDLSALPKGTYLCYFYSNALGQMTHEKLILH